MHPAIILITTVLTIASLYAPQPLLPFLAKEFSVSESSIALIISLSLAPLGIAPLCYGYFLESISAVKLLRVCIMLLSLSTLSFALSFNFPILLGSRIAQGIIIPAILTSLMTSISLSTPKAKLQRMMSLYISATITGGFVGRISAGIFSALLGWRIYFISLAALIFICFIFIGRTKEDKPIDSCRPKLAAIGKILFDPSYHLDFIVIFSAFFTFASIMNFIPFRVKQISPGATSLLIGMVYFGYLAGIFSSLSAGRLVTYLKDDQKAIILGICGLFITLLALLISSLPLIIASLFVLSAAMFLVHTICANRVNQNYSDNKGIVNGLYVAFYYAGGTLGSYLPGIIYEKYGWYSLIFSLCLVIIFSFYISLKLKPLRRNE